MNSLLSMIAKFVRLFSPVRKLIRFELASMVWLVSASFSFAQNEVENQSKAAGGTVKPPTSFLEIVFSGGPIGILIMCALIGLSITAAYLIFEHAFSLRRLLLLPEGLGEQVRQAVVTGHVQDGENACREQPSFLAFVLLKGLSEMDGGWEAVEKAVEDALAEQAARLFRRLEYLSVLANLSPMLGLLGTVVGMVLCFQEVANTQGNAGAAQLAEGIYQALVTTVAGLLIAIPSLGAFAVFRNRIDQFVAEGAYIALHCFGPLKRSQRTVPSGKGNVPPPAPPPPRPKEGGR